MYKKLYTILSILCFLAFFIPHIVWGAEFILSSDVTTIHTNDQFTVYVQTDTQGEDANAFSGTISYPSDMATLQDIRDGNSIINFWVDAPTASSSVVSFAGIIPGGYTGSGQILSLVFSAKKSGNGTIDFQDGHMLSNNGAGTEIPYTVSNLSFSVTDSSSTMAHTVSQIVDHDAPQAFVPEIAHDPNLLNGAWFVAFAANDKGSGVARYEVKETAYPLLPFLSSWKNAESPYRLTDQNLHSYVSVKAIDYAGNERIETVSPQNPIPFYANLEYLFILILGVIVALLYKKFLWKK
jgi:hypothetical protein